MRKEWLNNRPVPMDEKELDELIKNQAANMRAIDSKDEQRQQVKIVSV
jgi:UDP-glucose 6-dehydrogenase